MYWLYYGAVACTYECVLLHMCSGYCKKKVTFKLFIHLRHIHLECHTLYYIFITVATILYKELSSVYVHKSVRLVTHSGYCRKNRRIKFVYVVHQSVRLEVYWAIVTYCKTFFPYVVCVI